VSRDTDAILAALRSGQLEQPAALTGRLRGLPVPARHGRLNGTWVPPVQASDTPYYGNQLTMNYIALTS
jgi:hypothetical protein